MVTLSLRFYSFNERLNLNHYLTMFLKTIFLALFVQNIKKLKISVFMKNWRDCRKSRAFLQPAISTVADVFTVFFALVKGPGIAQFVEENLATMIALKIKNRIFLAILATGPFRFSIAPIAVRGSIKISHWNPPASSIIPAESPPLTIKL